MDYGENGEGNVSQHFSYYGASIEDIDKATAVQYDMHGGSAAVGSQYNDVPVQQSVLPSSISGKKPARERRVSHRGGGFKKDEDETLCYAFLNVGKDSAVGVNQSFESYYNRIYDYYQQQKPEGSVRSQISVQKRWLIIQKSIGKFCSCKSAVDRKNESGKNEYDRIKDAVKMYEKSEPFQLMHCWELLNNEPKWNEKLLEINTPAPAKVATGTTSNPQPRIDNPPMERPEGRDSAKRRRSKEDSASSSAAVEVLQQIHDRNKNTEENQEHQMQEILNMKGDKIQLTQKMFELQKQDMEVRSKHKEEQLSINKEQLSLTKQDIEVRAKQSEAQLLTAEVGIMGADLEKLSPVVRAYYNMMQRQILERRGVITPDNDEA